MIKGLQNSLKPFVKNIILDDSKSQNPNNLSQYNFYYGDNNTSNNYKINLTIEFCIKAFVKTANLNLDRLKTLNLGMLMIDNKQDLRNIISYNSEQKNNFINSMHSKKIQIPVLSGNSDLKNFVFVNEKKQSLINIPVEIKATYNKNISKENKNPNFLAIVYFLIDNDIISDVGINSEVIFDDGSLSQKTGYFVIGDSFSFRGEEQQLIKDDNTVTSFINRLTGESLNPNLTTDRNKQVNYIFGAPGDIWVGGVHPHLVSNSSDPNFGKVRFMAGSQHNAMMPHPFLKFITKKNNKIIDFRSTDSFEDLLSYKSSRSNLLSNLSNVIYTQQKNITKPIDKFILKKSIISNGKFSIRPVKRQQGSQPSETKDNLIFFFTLDKRKLLKQTTSFPELLERLVSINEQYYSELTSLLDITRFEIIRINKTNGESKSLLIGSNDLSFNDNNTLSQLGKNISKGFSLVNKTNDIFLETGNAEGHLTSYEFTDGEIDAYKDNNKYCYEIKLNFKDPLVVFLTNKVIQINKIIKDLDELMKKTGFLIIDPESGKLVKIYNEFQKQLNRAFVSQCLNPPTNPILPMTFSFDQRSELPNSVNDLFNINNRNLLQNLSSLFVSLRMFFDDSQISSQSIEPFKINDFINFVRSSLKLSNTSPVLIEKNRSLMFLLKNRIENILISLSSQKITKKTVGFTTKDYLNSSKQRQPNNLLDNGFLEFAYRFDNSIDLSKVKNHFDWIEEANHLGQTGGLKQINPNTYRRLVENQNITNFLTPQGQRFVNEEITYDYSFLPYTSPGILNLENSDRVDVNLNHLQTLRKKLISNITNTPNSVVVPELLSTFGIKFINDKDERKQYFFILDDRSYTKENIPINSGFEDNFGTTFSSINKNVSADSCNKLTHSDTISYGSTDNLDFEWAGDSLKNYPLSFALSTLNLITTNAYNRKNIDYLNTIKKDMQNNTPLPFAINLFSSQVMSQKRTAGTVLADVVDNLFNKEGILRFDKYAYYSYLLNIFARIYYLKGFDTRKIEAFGAQENKFSPTTVANSTFIKKMIWEPLSLQVINNIPAGKQIVCKIELFNEGEILELKSCESKVVDSDIIDMYGDYYNYNEIFLINSQGQTISPSVISTNVDSRKTAPIEINVESTTTNSRELLNREVMSTGKITRRQEQNESTEERSTKQKQVALSVDIDSTNESSTYIRPMRR